ncbi:MAG TPA: hypothetical protein ENF23_01080, partial [Methanosarcinales archaeon]|nr:hypothetical protein [Methanosarcinales archaeon]
RSTAMTSIPRRCASIAISFPSSPAPKRRSLSDLSSSGAARISSCFMASYSGTVLYAARYLSVLKR